MRVIVLAFVLLLSLPSSTASAQQSETAKTAEAAVQPQDFAPGIISTGHEFALTFTPDGKVAYFTRNDPAKKLNHIFFSHNVDGAWQPAEQTAFASDQYSDLDPFITPDGKKLFFVSNRPAPGADGSTKPNHNIWTAEWNGKEWTNLRYVENVNSDTKEGSPTVAKNGTLCFFSDRGREANSNSIYCAQWKNGAYQAPMKLGATVNAGPSDTSPFLAPDGKTLLFYSTRNGGAGKADLYATFREHGEWSPAVNLGPVVNTPESEYNPIVSRDGATLYFGRGGHILMVPLDQLHIKDLTKKRFKR